MTNSAAPTRAPLRPPDGLSTTRSLQDRGLEVDTLPAALETARADRSGHTAVGTPLAVVRARRVDDVVSLLTWADEHRVPIVPRGAGTGLAGGATAGAGEIVLDLTALNRIKEIRPDDAIAVVEPGVVTAELDRAARGVGLRYAPDPASLELSTIGGNIATNAGGLRCVKYGVTREAVLGLDVVLADGSLLRTGARTVKNVTGYDLTSLLVGSEGTLGVVVGATVRLDPVPVSTSTIASFFPSVVEAADAALALSAHGIRPATLELLDAATLGAIDAAQGSQFADRGGAFLLVQTDGFAATAEAQAAAALLHPLANHLEIAEDPEEANLLVAARRLALPSIERLGRAVIEDIAVPRSRLAEAVHEITRIGERTGVPVFTFAHAGDGNLHPILLADSAPEVDVRTAAAAIFSLALDLGGTVTGEHGVGVLKRHWLDVELDEATLAAHRRIKAALDPHGILNPGKAV